MQIELDERQQYGVDHNFGGLLVMAGPGSGKTAVISHRAARMIKTGVEPENLLLVTFSKKAANEMRERVIALTDEEKGSRTSIHTFHALGDKIIKQFPEACERQMGFTILDEGDQKGLFTSVLKEKMNVDKTGKLDIRSWLAAYNRLTQDGARAVESQHAKAFSQIFYKNVGIERQDQMTFLWHAFRLFEEEKRSQNVVDFNDLILLPERGMAREENIGKTLSDIYPIITIDESQDTNRSQYEIIHQIGRHHGNVMMVGDDDQSMYSWRGANESNTNLFRADFKAGVIRLEQNYRSTTAIIDAASQHIQNNIHRVKKKPFSTRDDGGAPGLYKFASDREMSRQLAANLKQDFENGTPWEEMAILYRKNKIGEMLEPALMEAGIPYEIQGGIKLTERKEVKLAVSLARLVNNPKDRMAFTMLAKDIKGLGERGLESYIDECRTHHDGVLIQHGSSIRNQHVRDQLELLYSLCERLKRDGPTNLIDALIEDWDIGPSFPKDKPEMIEVRKQRLATFKAWINDALQKADKDANPWQVIQRVLLEDPEADLSEGAKVVLSTAHRAKGLEWKKVHVAGYSDGLMPMRNKQGDIDNEEEERRISFVAMTRAGDELTLYHSDRVFLGYEVAEFEPSPYLNEFPHTVKNAPEMVAMENQFSWEPAWAKGL